MIPPGVGYPLACEIRTAFPKHKSNSITMKNAVSKSTLLVFSILLLTLPGLQSCKKDKNDGPALHEQLAGEWEITSFTVDGLEMMDLVLNSSTLEFEETEGSNGDYAWSFQYTDGSSTNTTGGYEVDEDAKELIFDGDTESEMKYELDINGDELELSGIVDGSRYELQLKRD